MLKIVALSLTAGVLGLFAATPAYACGSGCGGGGGSCAMGAAPVAIASAKVTRSYSYEPSGGVYRAPMRMRGGMMGGGSGSGVPRSAGAKAAGR
jgi:hypothetical protein